MNGNEARVTILQVDSHRAFIPNEKANLLKRLKWHGERGGQG